MLSYKTLLLLYMCKFYFVKIHKKKCIYWVMKYSLGCLGSCELTCLQHPVPVQSDHISLT